MLSGNSDIFSLVVPCSSRFKPAKPSFCSFSVDSANVNCNRYFYLLAQSFRVVWDRVQENHSRSSTNESWISTPFSTPGSYHPPLHPPPPSGTFISTNGHPLSFLSCLQTEGTRFTSLTVCVDHRYSTEGGVRDRHYIKVVLEICQCFTLCGVLSEGVYTTNSP